ncbi:MAG: alpha/beta hydrolase [Coriobacteriales bacterium]
MAIILVIAGSWAACSSEDAMSGSTPVAASGQQRADHVDIPTAVVPIPDGYIDESSQPGRLERIDYQAPAPDDPSRMMDKYAIVYLPYGYDWSPQERYNILYLMHGMGGWAGGQLGTIEEPNRNKRTIDNLIAHGDMEPMILVMASYYPDNEETQTNDFDAQLTLDFGTELRDYLMPAVEGTYRTYAEETTPEGFRASREHRAFGGFSMGGVTTWYRLCDSLDYFKYFIPVSGSLLWGVNYGPFLSGDKVASQIVEAVEEQGFGRDDYFVFTIAGSEDFGLDVVAEQAESLSRHQDYFEFDDSAGNANMVFLVSEGEGHDYIGYGHALYMAVPHISAMMNAGE